MDIELMDKSGYSIRIKITEQYAERFKCAQYDVYQIHNVKVTVFGAINGPVPQHRLVRVMRCSHHDTNSDNTPTGSNDGEEVFDWDNDDHEVDILSIPDDNIFDDEGQVWTDLKDDDDKIEEETLFKWFSRIGKSIKPTPLKLLKFAERLITTFEKGRIAFEKLKAKQEHEAQFEEGKVAYEKFKSKGVPHFLKMAAEETGLNKNHLNDYLRKFRQGPPSIKSHPWRYAHAIEILRRQKANGEKENRAAAAKEAGIHPGDLTNKLKKYGDEFTIQKQAPRTPELDMKALEVYRAQPQGKKNLTSVAASVGKPLSNLSRKMCQVGERQQVQSKNADKNVLEKCYQRLVWQI